MIMLAYYLSGFNTVAPKADSRKASIHAGSTGLTGLAGVARAHMTISSKASQQQPNTNNSSVRTIKTLLTLLTMFKASVHAGFNVTGLRVHRVSTCKGA